MYHLNDFFFKIVLPEDVVVSLTESDATHKGWLLKENS